MKDLFDIMQEKNMEYQEIAGENFQAFGIYPENMVSDNDFSDNAVMDNKKKRLAMIKAIARKKGMI